MIESEQPMQPPAARQVAAEQLPAVGFISLGCPKNQVDCELMISGAAQSGYRITARIAEAQAIVVNTCCFIQPALDEADEAIREALSYKVRGSCRAVIVAGCLTQYLKQRCVERYPDVDAWLSPDNPRELPAVLATLLAGEVGGQALSAVAKPGSLPGAPAAYPLPTFLASAADGRVLTTPPTLAYVKIAEGCSHRCSFCIIPSLRGRYRSRSPEDVETEVRGLAARGVLEIVLVSQDCSAYGQDLDGANLAALLKRLCAIEGDFWLRVLYLHPSRMTAKLIETWAALGPKLLPYFDIPLQHVSRQVLAAMGRGGDRQSIDELLSRIRAACPQAVIRSTLIAGFPGETDADFEELLGWVSSSPLDRLGVFAYSELPEMSSAALPGHVSEEQTQLRLDALMRAQFEVVQRKAAELVGAQTQVVVERIERGKPGAGEVAICRSWREAYEIDGEVRVAIPRGMGRKLLYRRLAVTVVAISGYDLLAQLDS